VIKKLLAALVVVPLCLLLFLFWLGYLSSRPPLTTDPATLAGDGSTTHMDRLCTLPEEYKVPEPRGRRYSLL